VKLSLDPRSSINSPTYFIADIAANHDGDLGRALELIELAAKSGANAAKFQNFKAETIVSKRGFSELGKKLTHQSKWEKDVFQVYKEAELPISWTERLVEQCRRFDIDYFTAPYDLDFVRNFATLMPYYKIGSGDITWKESIELMASTGKPILLATGASNIEEVRDTVNLIEKYNIPYVLMQCNTNYTGEFDNFKFLNLNVIVSFKDEFPNAVLGLSDHSQGHVAVLGAIALGARAIEKHFTDDVTRVGPDHAFSLDPTAWKKMVDDARILEMALGDGIKRVEENEVDARIVQRRALRFSRDIKAGTPIKSDDLIALRPCPATGISPFEKDEILGKRLLRDVQDDELVTSNLLADS
jgi:N-acetylneuraminate synthase